MAKQIPLTQGQVAIVDDWRYEELSQFKWHAQWNKHTQSFYAVRTEGKFPFRKSVKMHRQVMNTPDGMICDHRSHNTLDNQEHNLRNVTHSQSNMNRGLQSNNTSGERCIRRYRKGYMVQVDKGGHYVYCKTFRTLDEAIIARDAAIEQFHGDSAYRSES